MSSSKEKCDYMLSNLQSFSTHNIGAVADTTVAQSSNEIWQRARVGRITASNLGRVQTKMTSLSQRDDVDAIALLKTLMNYNPVNSNLSALVYGHNMAFLTVVFYPPQSFELEPWYDMQCRPLFCLLRRVVGQRPALLLYG